MPVAMYKLMNGFMSTFSITEYVTTRKAVMALNGSGEISQGRALQLLAGITLRMASYNIMLRAFGNIFLSLFGYEPEEEDELTENDVYQSLLGTGLTLMFGRNLGNFAKMFIALGIEKANELWGQDLRDGKEYDDFRDTLFYSPLNMQAIKSQKGAEKIYKTALGAYGPAAGAILSAKDNIVGSVYSKKKETRSEYVEKLIKLNTLEAAGNLGLVPWYKDVKKIISQDIYSDKGENKANWE